MRIAVDVKLVVGLRLGLLVESDDGVLINDVAEAVVLETSVDEPFEALGEMLEVSRLLEALDELLRVLDKVLEALDEDRGGLLTALGALDELFRELGKPLVVLSEDEVRLLEVVGRVNEDEAILLEVVGSAEDELFEGGELELLNDCELDGEVVIAELCMLELVAEDDVGLNELVLDRELDRFEDEDKVELDDAVLDRRFDALLEVTDEVDESVGRTEDDVLMLLSDAGAPEDVAAADELRYEVVM